MKYLWIIMLIVVYLIWLIATIIDLKYVFKHHYSRIRAFDYMEWYSQAFVLLHIVAIFLYSLYLWLK